MDNYIVSARKYRPSTFRSVVGQHALVNTLKNAVKSGRLAHSYLFCGQRGVGKTTMARIFAKAINCEHLTDDGEPCNECESCRAFNEQRSLNIIELDAASNNSVDDIRQLTDQVLIPPVSGRYRVFIVDEVHMLSSAAFNAFLKTLEEPPSYVVFILATTERQKILPTILSRCQKYDFQRITPSDIAEQLKYVADHEGYTAEPEALNVIAQKADGAMRDALSIFDQVAAASMGDITYEAAIDNLNILDYDYYFRLIDSFLGGNVNQSLLIYKEVRDHGFDSKVFVNGLASHLRELVVAHSPELLPLMEVTGEIARRYQEQAGKCRLNALYAAMDLCNTCDLSYTQATNKQFLVELTLIKICQLFGGDPLPGKQQQTLKKIEPAGQATPQSAAPKPQTAPKTPPAANQVSARPQNAAVRPAATTSAPQKAASAAPTPTSKPNTSGMKIVGVQTVSIKQSLSAEPVQTLREAAGPYAPTNGGKVSADEEEKPARNSPYTYEDFKEAWRQFVMGHPEEIILINAMKAAFPAQSGENRFLFTVDNQAQMDKFEGRRKEIVAFLRDHVGNDGLQLDIKVREKGKDEKIWTQKELLIDLLERNPKVKGFVDKYRLGLA